MPTDNRGQEVPAGSVEDRWAINNYHLLQMQLTDSFVAVFDNTEDEADNDELVVTAPLDAIGVARFEVTHVWGWRAPDGTNYVKATQDETICGKVVGLVLDDDGEWRILNEDENYMGMARRGADLSYFEEQARHYWLARAYRAGKVKPHDTPLEPGQRYATEAEEQYLRSIGRYSQCAPGSRDAERN